MIKYILNSGGIRKNPEGGKRFFAEAVKGLGNNPKVLICCFAQPREDWEKKFDENVKMILNFSEGKFHPVFELAFPLNFEQQIKDSDVIYINGGDDNLVQYWLRKFDIPKIFEDKVVAANSAGSSLFTKYFWTCDWRQCMDGFGILPIKFLPHFKSNFGYDDPRGSIDWDKAYEDLKNYKEDLPIYAPKEGEFIVINSKDL